MDLNTWGFWPCLLGGLCLYLAQKEWKRRHPRQLFQGFRGGVWIRQPNDSRHRAQNELEQYLAERGMQVFDLQRSAVEDLVHDGIWTNAISGRNRIDVAVIGQVIIQPHRYSYKDAHGVTKYDTVDAITLDLRFYAPDGEILGAFNARRYQHGADVLPAFLEEVGARLSRTIRSRRLAVESVARMIDG